MDTIATEVAIIGAGPIGLELAVALKRAQIDYLHFDARQIGYTISWFAPQTRFFSSNERLAIAGVPLQSPDQTKCTREQYLAYLRSVAQLFDLHVRTYEPVVDIRPQAEGFLLTTHPMAGQRSYQARRLVLATGGTAKPRRLNIPGEDLSHVSHYFQDPHAYFRKRLLIVGGRNSAVEAALRCYYAGAHVSLSYRRDKLDPAQVKYWLLPEINSLFESGALPAFFQSHPVQITPTHVTLAMADGQERQIPADFVLLLTGYEADLTLARLAGVKLQESGQRPVFDPRTMETNVPGLYVAGTATAGTQDKYRIFIENCHVHVERILAALTGHAPPPDPIPIGRPES